MKPLYCIPPTNRWIIWKEEPMGGTIPTIGHTNGSQRMDTLACSSHCSTQQSCQYHHGATPQSNPLRLQPHSELWQLTWNIKHPSWILIRSHETEPKQYHMGIEQGLWSKRTPTITIQTQRRSMARCISFKNPPSESQTYFKTPGTIQNNKRNIPSSLPSDSPHQLEDPWHISHITTHPLSWNNYTWAKLHLSTPWPYQWRRRIWSRTNCCTPTLWTIKMTSISHL